MALSKEIRQEDGVVTRYHRILFMSQFVNSHTSIVVASYVDRESRDTLEDGMEPYVRTVTYETDYDPEMNVESAYAYLKCLEAFADSEDC